MWVGFAHWEFNTKYHHNSYCILTKKMYFLSLLFAQVWLTLDHLSDFFFCLCYEILFHAKFHDSRSTGSKFIYLLVLIPLRLLTFWWIEIWTKNNPIGIFFPYEVSWKPKTAVLQIYLTWELRWMLSLLVKNKAL